MCASFTDTWEQDFSVALKAAESSLRRIKPALIQKCRKQYQMLAQMKSELQINLQHLRSAYGNVEPDAYFTHKFSDQSKATFWKKLFRKMPKKTTYKQCWKHCESLIKIRLSLIQDVIIILHRNYEILNVSKMTKENLFHILVLLVC